MPGPWISGWTISALTLWTLSGFAAAQAQESIYRVIVRRGGPPTPAVLNCAAATYDDKRDALLVFGGADPERKDAAPVLRRLTLGTLDWSVIDTIGAAPHAATLPGLVYAPKWDAVFMFGGWAAGADKPSGELWTLALGEGGPRTWKRLADGPPARNGCTMVLDARRDRLVLFAGDAGPHPKYGFTPLNDLWAFDLAGGTWTRLTPTGDIPAPRWNLAGAVDDRSGRMFIFGGAGYEDGRLVRDSFVFELDLAELTWTKRVGTGPQPPPVEGATLTYDAGRDLLLAVGGLSLADSGDPGSTSVWLYDLKHDKWLEQAHLLESTRRGHACIHDPRRDEHIVVGGETAQVRGNFYAQGRVLRDTLKLSLSSEK